MAVCREELKKRALEAIDKNKDKIIEIGDSIFNEPELGYKEFKTAAKVKKIFDELGISYRDEVAVTGVIAPLKGKESKVKVSVMGELDAVVVPTHPNADPVTGAAHSCAHNGMIAALVGVAYALKDTGVMEELSGDVVLMAVPAEEYVEIEYRKQIKDEGKIHFMGGKQEFVRLGEMDDIDMMVMMHNGNNYPGGHVAAAGYTSNGFLGKLVRYVGKAAHSGGAPHLGVNALNAASLGLQAVAMQRETFKDEDNIRVHPIITKGGDLVNVVPDDVRIETYVRGSNVGAILDANAKVDRAFKAGADAVGAQVIIDEFPGYLPIHMNKDLMDIMYENMKQLFGEDKVLYEAPKMAGSTDAGDISVLMPTVHPTFGGVSGTFHSYDVQIEDKELAYVDAAKGLVMTVIDLLADGAETALKVKENFEAPMTKEQFLKEWGKL